MIEFFKTIIYTPLYNFLILLLNVDWINAGIAAIVLTVAVKIVLYPLTKKTTITQIKMREKAPELASIKEKYKDKQVQAVKVMEFYKENKINPFASIFSLLIQIPIIFSLYYIFFKSGLPEIDTSLLYSFVKAPDSISMMFLGVDVSERSVLLALLAAGSTFWQMHRSSAISSPEAAKPNSGGSAMPTAAEFSQMMAKQMKYTMPLVVFFVSWQISGVVALYWFVSNLVSVAQEWWIKRKLEKI